MQVSVMSTGGLERRMEIQVPAERVNKAVEERLASMSRTVRLKGFRPGKVPVKVVRQQFGKQVRQEVLGDVMQSTFAEAVTKENLVPVGGPRIEPIAMDEGSDLKYRAIFEVFPQIQLASVEQIELTRPVAEVTTADVDAMIINLREQRPNYVAVEREARDTDRVTVDFLGTLDGVPFDGGKGENVEIVIGAGRMLPEFEAGLKGARAGEKRDVEVNFPANYQATNLAGKKASFAMTVHKVDEKHLPEIDAEFCKSFGVEEGGVEQLRKEVEENMKRELGETVRARLKQQLLDQLVAANPLEVPKTLIASEVRDLQMDAGRRMGARDASQLPPPEAFQDSATRRVAVGLLINEVIKSAKIELDRRRVQAKIEDLAQQYPDPAQAIQAYRENQQARRQIESMVLEDQVVDYLLERAKIAEKPATFKEIMNFGA
jgi:trigger factor